MCMIYIQMIINDVICIRMQEKLWITFCLSWIRIRKELAEDSQSGNQRSGSKSVLQFEARYSVKDDPLDDILESFLDDDDDDDDL